MIHEGGKQFTEGYTEGSNYSRRGVNNSQRGERIHGGVKQFTEGSNNSRRGVNNSRRAEIIHGGGETIHRGVK